MNLLTKLIIVATIVGLAAYLLPTNSDFPQPPPDALQSDEPADTETPLRRAYFTNYTRSEVIEYYKQQFSNYPTLILNYPPEDAQWIIRDQTRSYYLQELVHPFRSSLYINGFIPQDEKDAILIKGKDYYQKITIRYVQSNPLIRFLIMSGAVIVGYFVINEWIQLIRVLWKKRIYRSL